MKMRVAVRKNNCNHVGKYYDKNRNEDGESNKLNIVLKNASNTYLI